MGRVIFNPLLYTDPDGNNPIIGAIIGAAGYTLGIAFSDGGFKNWNWFGFASSVVVGAMTSGFASELGGAVSAGVEAGKLSTLGAGAIQAGAYGLFGGTMSMMIGGDFLSGALTGAAGSVVGSLTGLIPGIQTNGWGTAVQVSSSAAFGGIVSDLSGGNFWKGAAQAAIIAGFNHAAHHFLEKTQYEYNGKTYTSKAELYAAISADQIAEHYGIYDLVSGMTGLLGVNTIATRAKFAKSTPGTSVWSTFFRKEYPQTILQVSKGRLTRLPTITNGGIKFVKNIGAFGGRWVPIVGWSFLAYDAGSILYNTQTIYNKIISH